MWRCDIVHVSHPYCGGIEEANICIFCIFGALRELRGNTVNVLFERKDVGTVGVGTVCNSIIIRHAVRFPT